MRKMVFILMMAIAGTVFAHDFDHIPYVGGEIEGGATSTTPAQTTPAQTDYYSGGAAIGIATDHKYNWNSDAWQGSARAANYNYVNAATVGVGKKLYTNGGDELMVDVAVGKAFGADVDTLSISGGVAWEF